MSVGEESEVPGGWSTGRRDPKERVETAPHPFVNLTSPSTSEDLEELGFSRVRLQDKSASWNASGVFRVPERLQGRTCGTHAA